MPKIAVYPGSFDPITNGHLDVIQRAIELFDKVYVAVANEVAKKTLFTAEERLSLIEEAVKDLDSVYPEIFSGLVVDYAAKKNARTLIRGVRAISDFDYEFQMALTNRKLREAETIFLMPKEDNFYISSSLIKEIVSLKGSVEKFVPAVVADALKTKCAVSS